MQYSSIILASTLVSLISFVGLFAFSSRITKYAKYFVAIATGAMLGDVFFHILPEVFETKNIEPLSIFTPVLFGIIVMFLFETIFRHIHCHEQLVHDHIGHDHMQNNPLGTMNLIGNSLHNFLDGVLIAGAFLVSPVAGWATTAAIVAHEIPIETSNFMLLIHSGFSKSKALLYNGLTAIFGILGSVLVIVLGSSFDSILPYLSSFAAGFLLYISMSDLIPEIHTNHSKKPNYFNFILILIAIGFMYWLKSIEG
jgi:zinc and cadmium transporter